MGAYYYLINLTTGEQAEKYLVKLRTYKPHEQIEMVYRIAEKNGWSDSDIIAAEGDNDDELRFTQRRHMKRVVTWTL